MIDLIKKKIGDVFTLNYDTIKEHKSLHRCKIDVKCTKCESWTSLTIEALYRRKSENRFPYFCQPCTISEAMRRPEVRKKCKENSKKMWQNYNDIKQATETDNNTLETRLDDLLDGHQE